MHSAASVTVQLVNFPLVAGAANVDQILIIQFLFISLFFLISDQAEARFQYFISQLMPKLKDSMMAQTLIFVPSYFDFVRLRNYFRAEEISFAQICEYSKDSNVSRARNRWNKWHTPINVNRMRNFQFR